MHPTFARPLRPGDRIAVTAPSSGVSDALRPRLDFAVETLRARGFEVELGRHIREFESHLSAPVQQRAEELMRMLLDPAIAAIVPPWGGETAIDLLPHLDFEALRTAQPKWVVGYSDISTLLVPLTLVSGWATLHGDNLMDTPYESTFPSWIEVAGSTGAVRQQQSPVHNGPGWGDWVADPRVTVHSTVPSAGWRRIDGVGDVEASGRLIGGCIETVSHLAGTRFGDVGQLDGPHLVYLEAAEENAYSICRALHGMRLAGFFDQASAVIIGRTGAPDSPTLTQDEAVLDALGALGVPIVAGVDVGHVPPQAQLVNGAAATLRFSRSERWIEQLLQ
jgi:muramoyltetrapeptide carboxypeptidase